MPRGIVWLISKERYHLPANVTGITTLRTTWTKLGILTLTVGIVDPNYHGPLSTAVINFSKTDFNIRKGDQFFRTAFFEHDDVGGKPYIVSDDDYGAEVAQNSNLSSESFLTVDTLGPEIAQKIFGMPRWSMALAAIGLVVALYIGLAALIIPSVLDISSEISQKNNRIEMLEKRVELLEQTPPE